MTKETITNYLKKFNYEYGFEDEKIFVNLDLSLQVIIDLSAPGKVIITDSLKPWNYLTGRIIMSVKKGIRYNFIIFLILFGIPIIVSVWFILKRISIKSYFQMIYYFGKKKLEKNVEREHV